MIWLSGFVSLIIGLIIGVFIVYLSGESIKINLILSFIIVSLISPLWSIGIIGGQWICIAFLGTNPERDPRQEKLIVINFGKIFLFSLLTFSGFILTLVFYFRLKIGTNLQPQFQELFAWCFLFLIEVCFYRIIARWCSSRQRTKVGYGIGFINFLMIFYSIYPFGLFTTTITLISLTTLSPLLLKWVDYNRVNYFNNRYLGVKR